MGWLHDVQRQVNDELDAGAAAWPIISHDYRSARFGIHHRSLIIIGVGVNLYADDRSAKAESIFGKAQVADIHQFELANRFDTVGVAGGL